MELRDSLRIGINLSFYQKDVLKTDNGTIFFIIRINTEEGTSCLFGYLTYSFFPFKAVA